ncbi:MAG: hypothetical protein Q7S84_04250 [bacterium]|nr:hypothetical protein [bacterium]
MEKGLPTQSFVAVKEVRNGIVHLKDGGLRQLLIVSGVNFDLKAEEEQALILNTFQNFLNTLDFTMQCFIHSRKVNVDTYLDRMRSRQLEEPNELLKIQIAEYIDFIAAFVDQNAIISKTFFVVVPYDPPVTSGAATKGVLGFFKKREAATVIADEAATLQEHLKQLEQRVTQATEGLLQIGLRAVRLRDDETIELFYNLYNPELVEKKGLDIAKPDKAGKS